VWLFSSAIILCVVPFTRDDAILAAVATMSAFENATADTAPA